MYPQYSPQLTSEIASRQLHAELAYSANSGSSTSPSTSPRFSCSSSISSGSSASINSGVGSDNQHWCPAVLKDKPTLSPGSLGLKAGLWALAAQTELTRIYYNLQGNSYKPEKSMCFRCSSYIYGTPEQIAAMQCEHGGRHFIDDVPLWSLSPPEASVVFAEGPLLELVALDCEMVMTTRGSELAHIVVTDGAGKQLASWHVTPKGKVVDLLTKWSGISDISEITGPNAIAFDQLPVMLATIGVSRETYIVGHGLESDFKAMRLQHERVIDSALLFFNSATQRRQKLSMLSQKYLNLAIQQGHGHDPAEDARAALQLVQYCSKVMFGPEALDHCARAIECGAVPAYGFYHDHMSPPAPLAGAYSHQFCADDHFPHTQTRSAPVPVRRPPRQTTFVPVSGRICDACGEQGHMRASCPNVVGSRSHPPFGYACGNPSYFTNGLPSDPTYSGNLAGRNQNRRTRGRKGGRTDECFFGQ